MCLSTDGVRWKIAFPFKSDNNRTKDEATMLKNKIKWKPKKSAAILGLNICCPAMLLAPHTEKSPNATGFLDWIVSFVMKLRPLWKRLLLLNRGVRLTPPRPPPPGTWYPSTIKQSDLLADLPAVRLQPCVKFQQLRRNGTGHVSTLFCLQRDRHTWRSCDAGDRDRPLSNAPCSPSCDPNPFVPQQFGNIEIPSVCAELVSAPFKIKHPRGRPCFVETRSQTASSQVMQTREFNKNQHICILWKWNVFRFCAGLISVSALWCGSCILTTRRRSPPR